MLFVLPPLRGFWWSLGQGVSAQGVQFLSRTVRVRATPSYNLTFPAAAAEGVVQSDADGARPTCNCSPASGRDRSLRLRAGPPMAIVVAGIEPGISEMRNGTFGKSLVAVAAVAAILLAGVPARGAAGQAVSAGVCPEAQRCLDLLQDGIALIEGGRWDAASVLLGEVAAGLDGRPSHVRDLALAYVYLGVARLQVADADETRQWFAESQMRDPTLQLAPAEFPGDVLELWAEARDLGMLFVDTEPSGAEVSVDGKVQGRSPVGVAGLKPGAYRVALSHDGYAGVSRVLTVAAGRTERLFFSLLPAPGAVEARTRAAAPLTGIPDGVSPTGPSFGGAAVEQAPVNMFPFRIGSRPVRRRRAGGRGGGRWPGCWA